MNKKAFVTGGSRGIGAGVAAVLAESGYDVAFTYNTEEGEAEKTAARIRACGRVCFYYQASLERPGAAEEVTAQTVKDLGGVDLLVCNAGVTRHNDLLTLTGDFIDYLYNLNYRSYLMCAQVAANDMVARGAGGNIVFVASTRGLRAYPEDAVYGGLKAALIRSAESLALCMAKHNVRVNCVAPGATAIRGSFSKEELRANKMAGKIPLGRLGSPREVGYLVRYIASDEAAYMTGNTVKLDGGLILPGTPEKWD